MKIQFGNCFLIMFRCLPYFPAPSVTVLTYEYMTTFCEMLKKRMVTLTFVKY